jgi:hypothetical protein
MPPVGSRRHACSPTLYYEAGGSPLQDLVHSVGPVGISTHSTLFFARFGVGQMTHAGAIVAVWRIVPSADPRVGRRSRAGVRLTALAGGLDYAARLADLLPDAMSLLPTGGSSGRDARGAEGRTPPVGDCAGLIAQLAERVADNDEVSGSSPDGPISAGSGRDDVGLDCNSGVRGVGGLCGAERRGLRAEVVTLSVSRRRMWRGR